MPREYFDTMPPPSRAAEQEPAGAPAEQLPAPELKEAVEAKFKAIMTGESIPSRLHPGRNEDAVLGQATRVTFEAEFPPSILNESLRDTYLKLIKEWGQQEASAADRLASLGITGVFDGVSGGHDGSGEGLIGSRLVAKDTALALADAPLERVDATAQAAVTIAAFEAALRTADLKASLFNDMHQKELKGGACTTAFLARTIAAPDGHPQLVCAYTGNSRLFRFRPSVGQAECLTVDDTEAGHARQKGLITKEEYDLVNRSKSKDALPDKLKFYKDRNNSFTANRLVGDSRGQLEVSTQVVDAEPGDLYFIMTDGAHKGYDDAKMTSLLQGQDLDPAELLKLYEESLTNYDDATIVKIEIK